jgi:hypothetical protein
MSATFMERLRAELPFQLVPYDLAGVEAGLVIANAGNTPRAASPDDAIALMDRAARGFITRRSAVLAFVDARPASGPDAARTLPALRWLEDDPDVTILRKDCVNGFVGAIEAVHHGMHGTTRNRAVDWVNAHRLKAMVVTGLGTDACVMEFVLAMLSARNHGLIRTLQDIVVLAAATATHRPPPDPGHHFGLYLMASRGALLAGELTGV